MAADPAPENSAALPCWTVEFDDRARRELRKLSAEIQRSILSYLRERIAGSTDPKQFCKPLRLNLAGLWRYRIGDYRLICRFEDNRLVVLVLRVAHRGKVYEK
ncbi:type II toxin-antitoxin system RelE family toxin [Telmatobacter bradus]|uniref:type II toxin-antitoxin system RelE family toxin n=1 Tax=Telmatobacter bradus TaxID=474953 RepID=UPI003B43077C